MGGPTSPRVPEPGCARSLRLEVPRHLLAPQIRDHRLAGDRDLVEAGEDLCRERQGDVDPRAEADEADALAGGDRVALADEADDAPRDEAGDLHDADADARRFDDE